jgi:hypothetical protein
MPKTYEPIATTTLSSSASEVNFTSITGSYTDIILVARFSSTTLIFGGINLRFNGDSGANYSYTLIEGTGSAASSARASNFAQMEMGYNGTNDSGQNILINIQNYSNTTTNKTAISRYNSPAGQVMSYVGLWRNTAAITSIRFAVNNQAFASGSTITLYGIKAA